MDEHKAPAAEPLDDLSTVSLSLDRLRRFLAEPTPPGDIPARHPASGAALTCRP